MTVEVYSAADEGVYEPGELIAVARTDGKEVARTALRSAGTDLLGIRADRTELTTGDCNRAFVEITVQDRAGVLAHGVDLPVHVQATGAGSCRLRLRVSSLSGQAAAAACWGGATV
ncbi:hypothetical protein [Nocardia sp. NPDC003963]